MARVQATKTGYYKHVRIKAGHVFNMAGVDSEGYYLDEDGKRALFPKFRKVGQEIKEIGKEERKCGWVDKIGAASAKPINPKEVAAVISGKYPGVTKFKDDDEEVSEEEESEKVPSKGKGGKKSSAGAPSDVI